MATRRNNGEGAIRQKQKNLWEGRIVIGHKKDGSSIFKYFYAKPKKDCPLIPFRRDFKERP